MRAGKVVIVLCLKVVIVLCFFLLSGCASALGIGHETFKCRKTDESGRCGDPISIYKNRDKILREDREKQFEDKKDKNISEGLKTRELFLKEPVGKHSIDVPVPVRQTEEIARVFINSFKDHKGNLIGNIWVFTVVNEGDWLLPDGRHVVSGE